MTTTPAALVNPSKLSGTLNAYNGIGFKNLLLHEAKEETDF